MKYFAPKVIKNHPAVEECTSGDAGGSDYKHDVWLKDGWKFSQGRLAGCQGGLFHTVQDFRNAKPMEFL